MERNYHIIFHDDVDGIVSAAMYLHDLNGKYRLYPMSSFIRGGKFSSIINDMGLKDSDFLVILDYENHNRSNLWIDHHWSKDFGDKPIKNDRIIYNPNVASTARLINNSINRTREYCNKFLDTVDIIDSANYDSIDQIFNDTSPLMILRAYVERSFHSEMMFCRIVEMISRTNFDFEKALYQLRLDESIINELKKDIDRTKSSMVISGAFSIIRQNRPGRFPRYAEFYINREIRYSVRLSNLKNNTNYFQIGYNKWHEQKNEIDIGKFLFNIPYLIKGGGHYNVGGGVVDDINVEKLLDDLCINLNNGGQIYE